MISYNSRTGIIRFSDDTTAQAYSGHGIGRNNPALEADVGIGPIPVGSWRILPPYTNGKTGPYTMNLEPIGFDPHGRSLFRIHGNNAANDASHGCIVISPRSIREKIWNDAKDGLLEVTDSDAGNSSSELAV